MCVDVYSNIYIYIYIYPCFADLCFAVIGGPRRKRAAVFGSSSWESDVFFL